MRESNPLAKIKLKARREWSEGKSANIITRSDFKVKEVADVLSFQREFLGRNELSPKQAEAYLALWGKKGGEWNTKHHETVLLIGMKGGKNFWAEGDIAYTCYLISCMRDPHDFFSKITGRPVPYTIEKTFDLVNVSSVDEGQARRSFFDSVKKILKLTKDPLSRENWFEKYAGLDLREQFGDFGRREIIFPTDQHGKGGIRLLSFNSTSTAPEGIHILRYYADELSRASSKMKHHQAVGLLELGLNNTSASFPNRVGKVIEWSYPNDTDFDLTYERYELSHTEENILGMKCPTFEFNPSLTREMLEDRYRIDPKKARRVYECEKSISKDNFFQPYVEKLDQMVNPAVEGKLIYKPTIITRKTNRPDGTDYHFSSVEILALKGDLRKRCFTLDPSKVRDRFTILGGYNENIDPLKMDVFIEDKPEIIATNVRPVVDIVIVIEPSPEAPVDYIGVGDIFTQLIKVFPNTQSVNSDHFQNEKLRQEVIAKGVQAETYFFSNSKQVQLYTYLRANVWNNNIEFYQDRHTLKFANKDMNITEALIWEARAVLKDGNKIDHPAWGSKDILDSLTILNWDLMQLEAKGNTNEDLKDENLIAYLNQFAKEYMKLEEFDLPYEEILKRLVGIMHLSQHQVDRVATLYAEKYGIDR